MNNPLLQKYNNQINNELYSSYAFYDVYEVSIGSSYSDGNGCWGCIGVCCCTFPCAYTCCTGNPCCCGSL